MKMKIGMALAGASLLTFCYSAFIVGMAEVDADANSALLYHQGSYASGAIIMNEDCPIEVSKEELLFDVQSFPANYEQNPDTLQSTMSAKYTFKNPTRNEYQMRLLFPLGKKPDYVMRNKSDIERHEVTLNDSAVITTMRYTYSSAETFGLERDLGNLSDTIKRDSFYKRELPVFHYAVEIKTDLSKVKGKEIVCLYDCPEDGSTIRVISEDTCYYSSDNKLGFRVTHDDPVVHMYLLSHGDDNIENELKFYKDTSFTEEFESIAYEVKTLEESTFGEKVHAGHAEHLPEATEADFYNATVDMLNTIGSGIDAGHSFFPNERDLLRWYDYHINFKPLETVVNEVTAPLYPLIDKRDEPHMYTYNYLFAHTATWAKFSNLTVTVKTSNYISAVAEGFEFIHDAEAGTYTCSFKKLPQNDLKFTLCAEETPEELRHSLFGDFSDEAIITFILVAVGLLIVAAIILFV